MEQDATLVAGTRCYYNIKGESADYVELEGVRSLGRIGSTGSFVDQSTIKDTTKRYIGGVKDTEESTIRLANYASDTVQQAFLTGAQNSKQMTLKVVYPKNAEGNSLTAVFDLATSGYGVPETSDGNTILEYEVAYRMSGEPAFVYAQGGGALSMTAVEVTDAGETAAADGDYLLEQGVHFVTSGAGVKGTITVTVASGVITAATVTNGGLGYNVDDALTIVKIANVSSTTDAVMTVTEAS